MSTIQDKLNDVIEKSDIVQKSDSEKYAFLKTLYNVKNIEIKTEINNVVASCSLRSLIEYAKSHNLLKTAKTLEDFDNNYLKRMLSNKRQSREEAFKSVNQFPFSNDTEEITNGNQNRNQMINRGGLKRA